MAITQGINGTYLPAYDEEIEYAAIRVIKKKIHVNGVWEERIFIMLTDGTNRTNIQQWLKDHYGSSIYGETWWPTFNSVCMWDKIYTHWKLCE